MNTNKVLAIQYDPDRIIFQEDGVIYLKIDSQHTSIRFDMFDEKGSKKTDTISKELQISTGNGISLKNRFWEKELVSV
jgi:hypothetical protein